MKMYCTKSIFKPHINQSMRQLKNNFYKKYICLVLTYRHNKIKN